MVHPRGQAPASQGPNTTVRRLATHFGIRSQPSNGRTVGCPWQQPSVGMLVVLRRLLAIDLRRAYDLRRAHDLRRVCVRGSPPLFVCDRGLPRLFVCDYCSPQRGSDMAAQGNALGTGIQQRRSPERAQQPRTGHAQSMSRNLVHLIDSTIRGVFLERVAGRTCAAVHPARASTDDDIPGRVSNVLESPSSFRLMNGTLGIACLLRPFRAFLVLRAVNPGRCPGLTCCCPFGAKRERTRGVDHKRGLAL